VIPTEAAVRKAQRGQISETEYRQVLGLLKDAARHNDALKKIERSLVRVTGKDPALLRRPLR
jgi:hypothetical protein